MSGMRKEIRFNRLSIAIIAATMCVAGLANAAEAEFSYNGDNGPGYWSELDSEWSACAGTAQNSRQSPVNIDHARFDRNLRPLALQSYPTTVNTFNNGHTIQQKYEGTGSYILFEGKSFELLQFHFHSLSEHAIDGERGAMELHAVFQEPASGSKLVIGVMFDIGNKKNRFVQTLIDAGLPRKNGDTTVTPTQINLADVLPTTSSYFTYAGSLTTPPCTENVTWVVLADSARVSQTQFDAFRHILGNDFRPLQKLNNRVVRFTSAPSEHGHDRD